MPRETPLVITVTQAQLDRIDDAWGLCTYRNPRKIADAYLTTWFYWAVHHVTGVDVSGVAGFTFQLSPSGDSRGIK